MSDQMGSGSGGMGGMGEVTSTARPKWAGSILRGVIVPAPSGLPQSETRCADRSQPPLN